MQENSSLKVSEYQDVTVVTFQDTSILDTAAAQVIGTELMELVEGRKRCKIVLDFSKVRSLSSSIIGVVLAMATRARAVKGTVVVFGLRPNLREVFKLTKPDKVLTFADTAAGAFKILDVYITS